MTLVVVLVLLALLFFGLGFVVKALFLLAVLFLLAAIVGGFVRG